MQPLPCEKRPAGVGLTTHEPMIEGEVVDVQSPRRKQGRVGTFPTHIENPGVAEARVNDNVYAWLQWSPQTGSPCYRTMHHCFPGALPGGAVVQRCAKALEKFGMNPENTLYGQSICPDEINNSKGGLSHLMAEHWGENFPMGGIGGAPYVGKTGFTAFSNRVPEDGHIVIFFGPHIGISEEGFLGKYLRLGQTKCSTACGAVLAAYDSCRFGDLGEFDPNDMQQSWIKQSINKKLASIQSDVEPLNALIHVAYEAVRDKLTAIVNNNFGKGHLVLLGGIQLNLPRPFSDHFQPLLFQVHEESGKIHDLLSEMQVGVAELKENVCPTTTCYSVFSWLNWSPAATSPCYITLQRCFPGSLPAHAIVRRTAFLLDQFGLDPENTIYGQSICPDEINNLKGGLAYSMTEYWGECFPMGGIGGAPFVGKTGFAAFSHHVPDNGNVFVLFGPHIGISEQGELGKYLLPGQRSCSNACGAVLAAYEACQNGDSAEFDDLDMQQSWLKVNLKHKVAEIGNAEEPLGTLIHEVYARVRDAIDTVVNNNFGKGHLIVLGGVQINVPPPFTDHFQPLVFQVRKHSGEIVDLLEDLSGIHIGERHVSWRRRASFATSSRKR